MKYKFIKNLTLLLAFYLPLNWIPKGIFLNPTWISFLFFIYIINNIVPNKRINDISAILGNIIFCSLTILDIAFFLKQMAIATGEAALGIIIIFFDFIFLLALLIFMVIDIKKIQRT